VFGWTVHLQKCKSTSTSTSRRLEDRLVDGSLGHWRAPSRVALLGLVSRESGCSVLSSILCNCGSMRLPWGVGPTLYSFFEAESDIALGFINCDVRKTIPLQGVHDANIMSRVKYKVQSHIRASVMLKA
jgi:hypothetical protein